MRKIIKQKVIFNFSYYKNILFPLILIFLAVKISVYILVDNNIDTNVISIFIGGIITFIISYYSFYKTKILSLVKEKKENVYIPIIKELINNLDILKEEYLFNSDDEDSNNLSINTINDIVSNKEYYLLPPNILAWLNEYVDIYTHYVRSYKYEYDVFVSFLNFQNKNFSIEINKKHYKDSFFKKCLKAVVRKNVEIIGEIEYINQPNSKRIIDIEGEIFSWCSTKYSENKLIKDRDILINTVKELLSVFNYLVEKINKKYLKIIQYI